MWIENLHQKILSIVFFDVNRELDCSFALDPFACLVVHVFVLDRLQMLKMKKKLNGRKQAQKQNTNTKYKEKYKTQTYLIQVWVEHSVFLKDGILFQHLKTFSWPLHLRS